MALLFVAVLAILGFLCFTGPDGVAGQAASLTRGSEVSGVRR